MSEGVKFTITCQWITGCWHMLQCTILGQHIKENADRLLLDSKRRETVNTLIKANANIITAVNANDNERSEKVSQDK
jgi:hypothetical protein